MNGAIIKEYRETKNISQEDLGALIGVSRNTIYNWENGGVIPKSKFTIINKIVNNTENSNLLQEDSQLYSIKKDDIILNEEKKKVRIMKVLMDMLESGDLSNEIYLKLSKELLK